MNHEPITYLALGDSYTIGESVLQQENFPYRVVELIRKQGFLISDPEIIAVTGWTTGDLLKALETFDPPKPFDRVSLLIGVNNQYQGKDIAEYRREFHLLLQKAIGYAGGDKRCVMVLSIPDYSVTPFAATMDQEKIRKEVDAFNEINKEISLQEEVSYIDITGISRQGKTDPGLQAADGLHPSAKQYEMWAAKVAEVFSVMFI